MDERREESEKGKRKTPQNLFKRALKNGKLKLIID